MAPNWLNACHAWSMSKRATFEPSTLMQRPSVSKLGLFSYIPSSDTADEARGWTVDGRLALDATAFVGSDPLTKVDGLDECDGPALADDDDAAGVAWSFRRS